MNQQKDPNRNPEKQNLNEIKKYLIKKGYQILKLKQSWRNVVGKLEKDGKALFFKMGTNKAISGRVYNEYKWYELVNGKIHLPYFYSVKSINKGYYKDLFWFVADFIDGKLLAEKYKPENISETQLDRAVELIVAIQDLKDIKLPRDKEFNNKKVEDVLLEKAQNWAKEIKYNCEPLIDLINKNKKFIKSAVCHGDFTPWHIIVSKNEKIALIDAEHAVNYIRHYDAAYFYHRLYTTNQRPDLADLFLKKYKQKINSSSEQFEREFIPILAQRIVGGDFDLIFDKKISLKLNEELRGKITRICKS